MSNENYNAPGPYNEWTACEEYGHQYAQDDERPSMFHCPDCGDTYEDKSADKRTVIEKVAAQIAHNNKVLADA